MQSELSPIKTAFPWIPDRDSFMYGDVEFDLLSLSLYFAHPNWDRVGDPVEHSRGRYVAADTDLVKACLRKCKQKYGFKPSPQPDTAFTRILQKLSPDAEMLPLQLAVHGPTQCVYGPKDVIKHICSQILVAALCSTLGTGIDFFLLEGQVPIPFRFNQISMELRISCCEALMGPSCRFNKQGTVDAAGVQRVNVHITARKATELLEVLRSWKPYFQRLGLELDSMLYVPEMI